MSTNEERQAKRDEQRAKTDKWLADEEQKRLARPLVERLRDCGPFTASDGYMGLAVGNWKDSRDAADRIEELERQLNELRAPCGHNYNKFDRTTCAKPGCSWREE